MKKILFALVIVLSLFSVIHALPPGSKGPAEITLDSGRKKKVVFPHARHQDSLKDCMKCHSLFSKNNGVIKKMIGSGALEKKQVMNHCRDCHKKMKKNGEKSGPTKCSKCHVK